MIRWSYVSRNATPTTGPPLSGLLLQIYRLWIVWNYRSAIIIFPLCTLAGLTGTSIFAKVHRALSTNSVASACGIGITYQFTQYYPGENVFVSVAGRWITSDCVFTLW